MYPLLTFRRLFVHHLRLSEVAVSRKKSLSAPYPHCFVSLRNRGLQVRILPGVLTYVDLCPELCPVLGHTLGHSRQYFTDPAGILLDGIAQVILLCGAEVSMPHQLLDQVRWHSRPFQPDARFFSVPRRSDTVLSRSTRSDLAPLAGNASVPGDSIPCCIKVALCWHAASSPQQL